MVKTRRVVGYFVLTLFSAVLFWSCGTIQGKGPVPEIAAGNDFEGTVTVVEYRGSDIGEPVPRWMQNFPEELETRDEYAGCYVFRFELRGVDLAGLERSLQDFPFSLRASRAVHDRALKKADQQEGLSDGFVDEAGRVLMAIEYLGASRRDDFWVHELLVNKEEKSKGERYRGWVLVSVPKEQAHAALKLAYETADTHQPPQHDREARAREQLLAKFRLGL